MLIFINVINPHIASVKREIRVEEAEWLRQLVPRDLVTRDLVTRDLVTRDLVTPDRRTAASRRDARPRSSAASP